MRKVLAWTTVLSPLWLIAGVVCYEEVGPNLTAVFIFAGILCWLAAMLWSAHVLAEG